MSEKILIVDNKPEMLMLFDMLIREYTPYEPVTTNNPFEAYELIKKGGFSLVIAEMKMPVIDGIKLLEEIRHINPDIPVIITATYGTVGHAIEAMNKGAFDFITKPFRKEQILFAINKALKLAMLKKENRILTERLKTWEAEKLEAVHS